MQLYAWIMRVGVVGTLLLASFVGAGWKWGGIRF
jgi:hypothetical protein